MKTFPITQAEIDAYFASLPEATRADVAKMALLKAIVAAVVSQVTALEVLVGYDVVLVPDVPATPATPAAPASCGCGEERVDYGGAREQIVDSVDFRGLINDERGDGSWVTDLAVERGGVKWSGNMFTFSCFDLEPGKRAHFVGHRCPSSSSELRTESPAEMRGGTRRGYWVSRKPA